MTINEVTPEDIFLPTSMFDPSPPPNMLVLFDGLEDSSTHQDEALGIAENDYVVKMTEFLVLDIGIMEFMINS